MENKLVSISKYSSRKRKTLQNNQAQFYCFMKNSDPYLEKENKSYQGYLRPMPFPKRKKVTISVEFIPPSEKRRDDLRWDLKQKLEYSHPKYHDIKY